MFSDEYFQVIYDQCSGNISCINIVFEYPLKYPGNCQRLIRYQSTKFNIPIPKLSYYLSCFNKSSESSLWSISCFMASFVHIGSTYKLGFLKDFINKMQVQES